MNPMQILGLMLLSLWTGLASACTSGGWHLVWTLAFVAVSLLLIGRYLSEAAEVQERIDADDSQPMTPSDIARWELDDEREAKAIARAAECDPDD
jgi:hypothetical protein